MDDSDPYVIGWKRWKRWAIALESILWLALASCFSLGCFIAYMFFFC